MRPEGRKKRSDPYGFLLARSIAESSSDQLPVSKRRFFAPAGKHLFLPIMAVEKDNAVYDPDVTVAQLRMNASNALYHPVDWTANVDGVSIPNFHGFRLISSEFGFNLPTQNVYSRFDARYSDGLNIQRAVSDGYWIMLEPMSPGLHVIEYGGRLRNEAASAVRAYVEILPAGVPFITRVEPGQDVLQVTFWTGPSGGGSYSLEAANNLDGPWQATGPVVAGDGELHTVPVISTSATIFVRVMWAGRDGAP